MEELSPFPRAPQVEEEEQEEASSDVHLFERRDEKSEEETREGRQDEYDAYEDDSSTRTVVQLLEIGLNERGVPKAKKALWVEGMTQRHGKTQRERSTLSSTTTTDTTTASSLFFSFF